MAISGTHSKSNITEATMPIIASGLQPSASDEVAGGAVGIDVDVDIGRLRVDF